MYHAEVPSRVTNSPLELSSRKKTTSGTYPRGPWILPTCSLLRERKSCAETDKICLLIDSVHHLRKSQLFEHDLTVKLHPINYSPCTSQLLRKQKYYVRTITSNYIRSKDPEKMGHVAAFCRFCVHPNVHKQPPAKILRSLLNSQSVQWIYWFISYFSGAIKILCWVVFVRANLQGDTVWADQFNQKLLMFINIQIALYLFKIPRYLNSKNTSHIYL